MIENLLHRRHLHHTAGIHHRHHVRILRHHAQIMRDE